MSPTPKPPVLWSAVITRWAVVLLLAVALTVALRPTVADWMSGARKLSVSGDPANIQLVGVVPDGDDVVFDPRGQELPGVKLNWPGERTYSWSQQQMQRDLLFELGPGTEDLEFLPANSGMIHVSGQRGWFNSSQIFIGRERVATPAGVRRLLVRVNMGQKFWGGTGIFGRGQKEFTEVDYDLHFYGKKRGKAQWNFEGPFLPGRTNFSKESLVNQVMALTNTLYGRRDGAAFRAWGAGWTMNAAHTFAYDTEGRRLALSLRHTQSGPGGWTNEFVVDGVPLGRVAAITMGEQARVKTFQNIVVKYPGRPPLAHSPILDRLEVALGLTNKTGAVTEHHSPRNTREAVTILEFMPGHRPAMSHLAYGGNTTNFSELPPALREALRKLAMTWAVDEERYKRQTGLRTGLRGGWPEFATLALARLTNGTPQESYEALNALGSRSKAFGPEEVPVLAGLARTNSVPGFAVGATFALQGIGTPAATNALRELARAEEPWLWWSAIGRLGAREFAPASALDGEMQVRVCLALDRTNGVPPAILAAARARLLGLLSAEVREMGPDVFQGVLKRMSTMLDRATAMEAALRLLRAGRKEDWQRHPPTDLVREINGWYGKNFGGVGDGKKGATNYPDGETWPGIIEDVLEFGDKLPREGKPGP